MQPRVRERWKFFGAKFPKEEIIYFCQVLMVYIVVITSIVNLKIASFHAILPSNSSMKTYPDNILNHYVTALSNRIELDGDWEVVLSEMLFQRT